MKKITILISMVCIMLQACGQNASQTKQEATSTSVVEPSIEVQKINQNENTIATRFNAPKGYVRIPFDSISFSNYLRKLPLKPHGSKVLFFNGKKKNKTNVYDAVVDLHIGTRDLHQCADAVMRLRAEFLFENKKYDSIYFNFTNGFKADYTNWRKGKRIVVNGNQVFWKQKTQSSDTPKDFWKYLEMVFSYAGTASLEKELKSVSLEKMKIGDVFIQGGFPGHAVIVVDLAIHETTGEKLFLLAQSYMPAQEIQILKNPKDTVLSPWYSADISNELQTPEWTFTKNQLKRFQ